MDHTTLTQIESVNLNSQLRFTQLPTIQVNHMLWPLLFFPSPVQTYVPNVAPVLLCSFFWASLSDSVFNVSISCEEERKHKQTHLVSAWQEIIFPWTCCPNSPDGLPWKPEQFPAHQQYTFQGLDGGPGLESDPRQTYDIKNP